MNNEIIHLSEELRTAVTAIKQAILQSQYRAAKGVNSEQLSLYFGIGHYISEHSRTGYWGKGAIKSISEQLQRELPGLKGFGERQLKNMRTFYEEWRDYFNSAALATELKSIDNEDAINAVALPSLIRQPLAAELSARHLSASVLLTIVRYWLRPKTWVNAFSISIRPTSTNGTNTNSVNC